MLVLAIANSIGCATFGLGKKDDEYDLAKRTIEGRFDSEGNFVRPEGALADKRRANNLPGPLKNIPLLGTKPANSSLAKEQFAEAERIFERAATLTGEEREEEFAKAGKLFDKAGSNWISSHVHQDSLMMAAESYFFAEKYPTAENRYAKLLKEYPRTKYQDRVDQRRMEIGQFWQTFDDQFYNVNFTDKRKPWNDTFKHGVRVLERMRLDSPTGKLADDATMKLANGDFEKELYVEALDRYDELITSYPDSRHQYNAHFLAIKSALLSYRGPDYSQEPLDKADKYFKNLKQFPEDSRRDKEAIDEMYTELVHRKAERLYHLAIYRFNKGEARSSRMKCLEIVEKYDETAYAEPARNLLRKMEGMPDEPTPYLSDLAKLFPSNDKTAPLHKPLPAHLIEADKQDQIERTARALGTPYTPEGTIYR